MDFYATLKINDGNNGKLLEETTAIFECDNCENVAEFGERHSSEVSEFLENKLRGNYSKGRYIERYDIVMLSDCL